MNIWQAILAYVIGPTVVAIGTYLAARAAASGSKHAADRSSDIQEENLQITGFHQLVADLQSARKSDREDIDRLRRDYTALDKWREEAEEQMRSLKHESRRDKDLIRRLVARLRAAITEIQRLGGTVPPDSDADLDRITVILDAD